MMRIGLVIGMVVLAATRTAEAKGAEWSKHQIQQAVIALCIASNTPSAYALDILKGNAANPFPSLKRTSESKGRIDLAVFETGHPGAPRLTIASLGNAVLGLEVELKPGSLDRVRAALRPMRRLKLVADDTGRVYSGPYDSVWGSGQVTLVGDPGGLLKCVRPVESVPGDVVPLLRELGDRRFADVAARSGAAGSEI
jgi:hypothetical protein